MPLIEHQIGDCSWVIWLIAHVLLVSQLDRPATLRIKRRRLAPKFLKGGEFFEQEQNMNIFARNDVILPEVFKP